MKFSFSRLKWSMITVLFVIVTGCAGSTAPPQFYMLTPPDLTSANSASPSAIPPLRIGLEPVEVPAYLNQPQIVTHLGGAEYQLDEFNRWLEPLSDNLTRVITEHLSEMLNGESVDILSMSRPVNTDYTIAVQILRMDGELGKRAVVVARWSIFDSDDNTLLQSRRSVQEETPDGGTYPSLIQIKNRMIESLSREIADGIAPIIRQNKES